MTGLLPWTVKPWTVHIKEQYMPKNRTPGTVHIQEQYTWKEVPTRERVHAQTLEHNRVEIPLYSIDGFLLYSNNRYCLFLVYETIAQ